ncbi:MAG: malonyl-CoA decarboxylase [Hyphomicrobiales bacterium]|nr:malonyl-CoA decarboxylase [Hyphomicrobiales bacterium]
MNVSFFQEMLNTISERGRLLLDRSIGGGAPGATIEDLARSLLSGRGEASGVAIASSILSVYRGLEADEKLSFFQFLANDLGPDQASIAAAARAYLDDPTQTALSSLAGAVESPRQEFFRRLNLAPGATAAIVAMRRDLIRVLASAPELASVDTDSAHLLASWFNRGFLVLKRIDWSTPASILEKIIEYEAVHEISGWDELRRRLDPRDRRCYGFFHPSLVDEPLIFVEVALTREIPGSIQELLSTRPEDGGPAPTTAVFYSISNCQDGLRGISFGNFLIKQVAEELAHEVPSLKTFVTLSPVPRFAAWLVRLASQEAPEFLPEEDRETLKLLEDAGWAAHAMEQERLKAVLLPLAAAYFLLAKTRRGRPVDPVARFHLGNGARLERINWLGDKSEKGLRQSHGLMVNYLYDLKYIEKNHEAYANDGTIAASRSVRSLLKVSEKSRALVPAGE